MINKMKIQEVYRRIKRALKSKHYWACKRLYKNSEKYDDREYLEKLFYYKVGYKLNLDNPRSYNEKIQWLKLYDHNPLYTRVVDKAEAKEYVKEILGNDNIIIPTIAVYNSVEEIDFDKLPDQFVLKCTHDSGTVVICEDKSKLDKEKTKDFLRERLKRNYFLGNREWPYKNVPHRIICEKYMSDGSGKGLVDYKFFCFDGVPKMVYVGSARMGKQELDHFDMDFKLLPFERYFHHAKITPKKPDNFEEMKLLAEKLSKNFLHVRVDFYDINGQIYFGELTLHPGAGVRPFNPVEWDYKVGEWLHLPTKTN